MGALSINNIGRINIENNAIAAIAGMETIGCFGVVGMTSAKKGFGSISDLLKRDNITRGVEVFVEDGDAVTVRLHIVAKYGVPIKTVSQSITDAVTYRLSELADLKNVRVSINIEDIIM